MRRKLSYSRSDVGSSRQLVPGAEDSVILITIIIINNNNNNNNNILILIFNRKINKENVLFKEQIQI